MGWIDVDKPTRSGTIPIMVGGDDSVQWVVEGDNVREANTTDYPPEPEKPRKLRHDGVDRTNPGEYFTVVIKLPRRPDEREAFIAALKEQIDTLGETLTLPLPIEDREHNRPDAPTTDQIRVLWASSKSLGSVPHKGGVAM